MNRLFIDEKLGFGKHRGKTPRQVFCGVQPISEDDLEELYRDWGSDIISKGDSEHYLHSFLNEEDWYSLLPPGQRLVLFVQPDPSYIDWLVNETEDLFIAPDDLCELEKLEVSTLQQLVPSPERDGTLVALYANSKYSFPSWTHPRAAHKMLQWLSELPPTPTFFDDPTNTFDSWDSDSQSSCPACGEMIPCGCNYALEKYC